MSFEESYFYQKCSKWERIHRATEFLKQFLMFLLNTNIIRGEFKKKKLNSEIIAIRD